MEVTPRRSPKYVAVLAAVAGLILIGGWLARPRDVAQSPPAVPSETELQELARRAERRSLDNMTAYFANLAAEVRPSFAYVPSIQGSGLIWDEARIVAGPIPIAPPATSVVVRTASGERHAEATVSRRLPLSVLEVSGLSSPAPRRAATAPRTGDWIVAVWQTEQGPAFAAGNVRQLATTRCAIAEVPELVMSTPLSRSMVGGGVFNMDRELVGVILPCADRVAAIEPSSIDDMAKRTMAVEERLLTRHGTIVASLSQDEGTYFADADGLLVREVWIGTSADAAGLRPGDLIIALNGQSIASLDDLRPLAAASGAAFELKVRRGGRTETLTLDSRATAATPSGRPPPDPGLILEGASATFRIESLVPGSRAARAGLAPGDRVLRINGNEPRSRAQAERALAGSASVPILLEIERDNRRIAVVIPRDASR